jgi:hypothetical protein
MLNVSMRRRLGAAAPLGEMLSRSRDSLRSPLSAISARPQVERFPMKFYEVARQAAALRKRPVDRITVLAILFWLTPILFGIAVWVLRCLQP